MRGKGLLSLGAEFCGAEGLDRFGLKHRKSVRTLRFALGKREAGDGIFCQAAEVEHAAGFLSGGDGRKGIRRGILQVVHDAA